METQESPDVGSVQAEPQLSPLARAIAIFANPTGAWTGLRTRAQFWFPLLVMILSTVLVTSALHERAMLPMMVQQWERLVEDGRMTPQQVDQMEERMSGPAGIAMVAVPQVIFWPLFMLLLAAGVSFGVSFILGSKLGFRHALEVVTWSTLVLIPAQLIGGALGWVKETMQGIHLGLGILVPTSDPPERWQLALGSFLDAFGPFDLWCLAVVIIGASTLSGAPRKSVMWVLGGLYLGLRALAAGMAFVFQQSM